MSGATTSTPMLSIFAAGACVGFVLARGKLGHEAFDAEQHSRGIFSTQAAAVAALVDNTEAQP